VFHQDYQILKESDGPVKRFTNDGFGLIYFKSNTSPLPSKSSLNTTFCGTLAPRGLIFSGTKKKEASEAMTNRLVECMVQFELDCCSSLQSEWMRAFERYGCIHLSDKNEKGNTMNRFFNHKTWVGNTLVKELFGYKVVLQRHAYEGTVRTGSKYWIRRRLDLERQYNQTNMLSVRASWL
jgi:hypothetical protein